MKSARRNSLYRNHNAHESGHAVQNVSNGSCERAIGFILKAEACYRTKERRRNKLISPNMSDYWNFQFSVQIDHLT